MLSSKLLSTSIRGANATPSRSICHKTKLKPKRNNYRWPYERRSWGPHNFFLDPDTAGKFDENTKMIQVEGNISSGKEDFAKKLAEELGMAYFPQPNLNDYYINKHGFDYMALNALLPERLRYCDWEMFHENPSRHSVIHMQHYLLRMRVFQHCKGIAHLMNTGQGVVQTRTCFTERAIVEAMHNVGWLPRGYLRSDGVRFFDWKARHLFIRNIALASIYRPHLTIYLDTPVDTCLKRIKEDPDPMISKSNAHTREFLEEVETAFKDVVLPKQEHSMHVMMIDHPEHKSIDEVRDIVDEIENMDFEFEPHDTKFEQWNPKRMMHWHFDTRWYYTTTKYAFSANTNMEADYYDIAGLGDSISYGDIVLRDSLLEGHVGPVGYLQDWQTDQKVHGFWKGLFGAYQNHGERVENRLKLDCL